MKRLRPFALAVLAFVALATAATRAQETVPTPTPNPLIYNDPAMNFQAPPDAVLLALQPYDPKYLSSDIQPLAAWGINIKQRDGAKVIKIEMENFAGDTKSWEGRYESQAREKGDIMIRGVTPTSLSNGMPAYFMEITSGNGLETIKQFVVCWSDGARGVALSVTARLGDIDAAGSKVIFSTATAVRYPSNQP
ncbi:MAG: hypothetical protein JO199_05505 [Candidatus Eremiobacteraeota bacterium]|nr:hypothetical protein [Candidatus Eremiobacteraeota bacterium]